jgi:nitrogen regulatory protein PII
MKAVFITFDQAHYDRIIDALNRLNCRGFTAWQQVSGRGSDQGEPHYGSHAWPSLASALITIVPDNRVEPLLNKLREFNDERPKLGLRAFVWTIDQQGV